MSCPGIIKHNFNSLRKALKSSIHIFVYLKHTKVYEKVAGALSSVSATLQKCSWSELILIVRFRKYFFRLILPQKIYSVNRFQDFENRRRKGWPLSVSQKYVLLLPIPDMSSYIYTVLYLNFPLGFYFLYIIFPATLVASSFITTRNCLSFALIFAFLLELPVAFWYTRRVTSKHQGR